MATATAQTELQILQIIHSLYEGNTSYPASTEDDYLVRRDMANEAVMKWDMYKGTLWNELWTSSSSAPDGAFSITSGAVQYALPTDFRFMGGFLRLIDANNNVTFYQKRKQEAQDVYEGQTNNSFSITGNAKAGFKINFLRGTGSGAFPLTTDIGKTIKYEYYKRPQLFTATTDIPEMSNPDYIVHYVLSYLYRQDDNFEASDREMRVAEDILSQMQSINMMSSWREQDRVLDGDWDDNNTPGFGL